MNVLALWAKLGALDLVEHQEEHKRQRDQHRDAQADDALFPEIVPGAKRQEWQEDDGRKDPKDKPAQVRPIILR